MNPELTLLSAFLIGLFGSVHCIGMCGSIAGALTFGIKDQPGSRNKTLLTIFFYNLGRITSYVIAGIVFATLGRQIMDAVFLNHTQTIISFIASSFMLMLGLYVGGWWSGLVQVEKLGGYLWRHIEPFSRHLLPVKTLPQATLLGLIWGWLPCGMVYSMLVWSLSAGSMMKGALLMLGFGLGTLPTLFVLGGFANELKTLLQKPTARHLAGGFIIFLACVSLVWLSTSLYSPDIGHDHH